MINTLVLIYCTLEHKVEGTIMLFEDFKTPSTSKETREYENIDSRLVSSYLRCGVVRLPNLGNRSCDIA